MQFSSKTTAALSLLALLAVTLAKPCPAADANLKSLNRGDGKVSVTFRSQIDEELQVYWMTRDGEEHDVGILESLGEVMHQSFEGHAFRVRRMVGGKEVVAETLLGRSTRQRVVVEACGAAFVCCVGLSNKSMKVHDWHSSGVLSEEEGLSKAKDGSIAKLDGIVIGTKYSEEQRERIRAALPGIPTCEPGIHFAGGHGDASTGDRIIADLAEKLK